MTLHGIVAVVATISATAFLYNVSGGGVSLVVLGYGLFTLDAIINAEIYGCPLERDW